MPVFYLILQSLLSLHQTLQLYGVESLHLPCDSCGVQHSNKKRHILYTSYIYENFVEFHHNIAEGIYIFFKMVSIFFNSLLPHFNNNMYSHPVNEFCSSSSCT
jgi:hypothetical protein